MIAPPCGVLTAYDTCNQGTAIRFIDDVLRRLPFRVLVVQTDYDAEFSHAFTGAWMPSTFDMFYIRPRTRTGVGETITSSARRLGRSNAVRTANRQNESELAPGVLGTYTHGDAYARDGSASGLGAVMRDIRYPRGLGHMELWTSADKSGGRSLPRPDNVLIPARLGESGPGDRVDGH